MIKDKRAQLHDRKLCPRCHTNYLDPTGTRNALSRADDKTYICSDCGIDEALQDYYEHYLRGE